MRLNPDVPVELERIINQCLEKDRNLRYQHASDMRTDLQRLKRDTESTRVPAASPVVRNRRVLWIGGAAVVIVAAVLAGYFFFRRPAKPLTERDTIVLADFSNSTGDPVFDDTLKTALSVALNQSPFLNVLSDNNVVATLRLMTRPADTKLTPDIARELCERAGSKAYIAGSIASLGNEYVLGLKAVNCQSGDPLAEEQVTSPSKEKVLDAVGEAASKLRRQLGESVASVRKFDVPLSNATTSSLEALKAYSLAAQTEDLAARIEYLQRAIQLDPNFASAYSNLAAQYNNLLQPGRGMEYEARAFQLREHASERERLEITADYYSLYTGELSKAAEAYQQVIASYPKGASYTDLGAIYPERGQYEKAIQVTRQTQMGGEYDLFKYNLAVFELALQHFGEAKEILRQVRDSDVFQVHVALSSLAFLQADSSEIAKQWQWFEGKPEFEDYQFSLESDSEAYAGHLHQARQLTRRSVDSALRLDRKETGAISEENAALREAVFGNVEKGEEQAAAGLELASADGGVGAEAALAFAIAGSTAHAESLAKDLKTRFPLDTQMQSLWLSAIRAQLALDRNNPTEALGRLPSTGHLELGATPFAINLSCVYPTYIRGEAYLAAGQGSAAVAEFQKILDHSGIV